jgi:hypothetical protein
MRIQIRLQIQIQLVTLAQIWIRIQVPKMMQIRADAAPQHWSERQDIKQ